MKSMSNLSLFLENNQDKNNSEAAYVYDDPIEVISATIPEEMDGALERIEHMLAQGKHVAGWISYEAGLYFESKLLELVPDELTYPLIYMGVYETRKILSFDDADHYWRQFEDNQAYELKNLHLSLTREEYESGFNQIQEYLKSGDIYQVNFTQMASFDFKGSSKAFYAALRSAQQVDYAAYIESDDFNILSLSPELFIKKTGDHIVTKPMKGTCKRGRWQEEDQEFANLLHNSEKERAENLMIVDLLRNDLSKFANEGSVNVSNLHEVEKYRTLFTMTSTIAATVDKNYSCVDLIKSVFPCGSVTGAPKIRAQQIIDEIEGHQRGVYTGAIGYFTPCGDMCFSVPIRTITVDRSGAGRLGIGGAIVADSVADNEYDECLLKAQFVTKPYPKFDLIESFRWSKNDGFRHLEEHLSRLKKSADYFAFAFDRREIERLLKEHVACSGLSDTHNYKTRLLISKLGNVSITTELIEDISNRRDQKIILSEIDVDSTEPLFFHKTTARGIYKKEHYNYCVDGECLDVIFKNERGEITEGSYTNLFIRRGEMLYTPPIECGLLPGIQRQIILNDPTVKSEEKKLYQKDLEQADQIYISNSVRGLIAVQLV